jgi:hypothetical protein
LFTLCNLRNLWIILTDFATRMIKILIAVLLFCTSAAAQIKLEVKNASKLYDVRIDVERCEDRTCEGKATFTLFKKHSVTPFQAINLPETWFMTGDNDQPSSNLTRLYDEQGAVRFADYNFDGIDDLALCDGRNGGYGSSSYQIYLFSRKTTRFFNSPEFSELGQDGLGMFEVDAKRKILKVLSKSGCCLHMSREYSVVRNRPRLILEVVEDAAIPNDERVKITTRKLVNGRWQKRIKYVQRG